MEPVPPPHERSWRHPSELPPPPLESPTRSFRIVAAATGAASVALVGLFALAITPADGPLAISSSTVNNTGWAGAVSLTSSTLVTPAATTIPGERSVVLVASSRARTNGIRQPGETHTTVWISDRITADALLIKDVGGISVVDLDDDRKIQELDLDEYIVSTSVPRGTDEVTVIVDGVPRIVSLDDIEDLHLEPGTAVFDRDGKLIALTDHDGKPVLIVTPPPPSTTVPPPPGSPTTTTLPPPDTTDPATTTTTAPPRTTTTTAPPRTTTTTEPPPRTTTTEPPTTTTEPPTTTTEPPPTTTTTEPPTTTTEPPPTTAESTTTTTGPGLREPSTGEG